MEVRKVRLSILLGEAVLGAIGICLVIVGHYEGALGVAGLIGTTMHKMVESEEKTINGG